jgi:hypothetical protein
MPLSELLLELHRKELKYFGDPHVVEQVADKEVHLLGGITTIGKTSLLNAATRDMADANHTPSAVDRPRKKDDPAGYLTLENGITEEKLVFDINDHALINYAIFPTGKIYATYPEFYTATHNFIPAMTSSFDQLAWTAFRRCTKSYVVMPGKQWEALIENKDFGGFKKERMEEAIMSLTYAERHAEELEFIQNNTDKHGMYHAKIALINIALGGTSEVDKETAIAQLRDLKAVAIKHYELAA